MFGLSKKKKKNDSQDKGADPGSSKPAKKKKFSIKLIIILLLSLIAVGASAFVVYKFWFSAPDTRDMAPVYKEIDLPHVSLPGEMLKFSFKYFPDLYTAIVEFNRQTELFEKEIARIEQIAAEYPDQKKIAQKEKKIWVKAKNSLKKTFLKVEKPVKEIYVLYRVNEEQGLAQIDARQKELTQTAQNALIPAQQMTRKLKQTQVAPKGFIKGTLYKLKKKFL